MVLARFYPIVDDVSWIVRLVPLGVRLVQLRIKESSDGNIGRQLREARAVCSAHGAQLVVNDHWRIAIEEGCDFVHLGQEDIEKTDFVAFRKAGLKLGVSTHTHRELERVLPLKPDYVALGPIFATRLKPMRYAPQGLVRLAEWKRLIGDIPLVAIGGLTVERGYCALLAGADIVSVVTDVTRNLEPERRVLEWLAITRR